MAQRPGGNAINAVSLIIMEKAQAKMYFTDHHNIFLSFVNGMDSIFVYGLIRGQDGIRRTFNRTAHLREVHEAHGLLGELALLKLHAPQAAR